MKEQFEYSGKIYRCNVRYGYLISEFIIEKKRWLFGWKTVYVGRCMYTHVFNSSRPKAIDTMISETKQMFIEYMDAWTKKT